MTENKLRRADLAQFTGSECFYRHWLAHRIVFTEGVKYVADMAAAYWLLDDIVFAQRLKRVLAEEFQLWRLRVDFADSTARLVCEDGDGNRVFAKRIEYTDFPLEEIVFYFVNGTVLLPSEY